MKQRPIIFSTPMVLAILAGKKTQTRRIVKVQPPENASGCVQVWEGENHWDFWGFNGAETKRVKCPYGVVGDQLWVRETTIIAEEHGYREPIYVASELGACVLESGLRPDPDDMCDVEPHDIKLRPSIFMPRNFCRILLEITDIRVERVQDISEQDAIAEGCPLSDPMPFIQGYGSASASGWYSDLFNEINGGGAWRSNPWVWVIEFKRVEDTNHAN